MKKVVLILGFIASLCVAEDIRSYFVINKLIDIANENIKNQQKNEGAQQQPNKIKIIEQKEEQDNNQLKERIKKLKDSNWEIKYKILNEPAKTTASDIEQTNEYQFKYWAKSKNYLSLIKGDCASKMMLNEGTWKLKQGVFQKINPMGEWEIVLPNTIGEDIYNAICKD